MTTKTWTRVTIGTAEAAAGADLEKEALALLKPELLPEQFYGELVANKAELDAVRFLAQALPHREAVWWALQCVRANAVVEASDGQMLALAERWVRAPDEAAGRAAFAAAQSAGLKTGACWVAVASFWSGPSIAPPSAGILPPGPTLAGKAVSGAILLAAVSGEPKDAPKRRRAFLEIGVQVASGRSPFPA